MLIGESARLRAIEADDVPRYQRWLNDPRVRDNLLLFAPLSLEDERGWFQGLAQDQGRSRYVFAIDAKDESGWAHVGSCGLESLDWRNRSAALGLFIAPERHGQGHGTAAIGLLLGFGFDELDLQRIELDVFDYNPRAQRLYERLGFVFEGTRRSAYLHRGERRDVHRMAMLAAEWRAGVSAPTRSDR